MSRWIDALRGRPFGMDADDYWAVSDYVKTVHVRNGFPAEKIKVLPNASMDLNAVPSDPAHARPLAKKLVYVGALLREKGVTRLVELACVLPDYEFVLIGEGVYRSDLERIIDQKKCSNIHLLGRRNLRDKVSHWENAFFTLIPSLCSETFGLTAAESFSLGIPVLTTGAGGLEQFIRNGEAIRDSFASPNETATRIRTLWQDRSAYEKHSFRARRAFETSYSEPVYATRISALLNAREVA